jgi:hypothetical protein
MKSFLSVILLVLHIIGTMYVSVVATELMSKDSWLFFLTGIIFLLLSFYSVYLHIKYFYLNFKNKKQ